jgi:hypothetical protein
MVFTGERRYFGLVPVGDGHTYGFAGLDGAPFHDPPRGAWTGSGSTSTASDPWLPATSPP